MTKPIRVAVTGAAGQIGYSLLFRIASGAIFGPDRPVILSMLEITPALTALEGTMMELDDCAFPLLTEMHASDKADVAFEGADWVILVGGMPRKQGMDRADLIKANGPIFVEQGQAIGRAASADVRVLVVANPCNTNCLIARHYAPNIADDRWFAMTRLDQNRAQAMLARKANVSVNQVSRLTIWGNHSDTQYPDYKNTLIGGAPATEVITDTDWFEQEFIPKVAKRGGAIIKARGASSAASAASAAIDSVRSLVTATPDNEWFSAGVLTQVDNPYGIPAGLIYSHPLRTADGHIWSIVPGLPQDEVAQGRIQASVDELIQEREAVKDLIG